MSNKNLINGEYDWAKSFGSSGSDIGADITISNDGSIFISGWTVGNLNNQIHAGVSNNSDGINDAYVMKLDSNGNEQWTKLFGTTEEDNSYAVHLSNDGFIYITGETSGNLNNQIQSRPSNIFIRLQLNLYRLPQDANQNFNWRNLNNLRSIKNKRKNP